MRKTIDNVNHKGKAAGPVARDDVLELVHGVMHAYRSLQYRALRDDAHEITHMDSKVLGFFDRRPGATLSDLAAHSGRDKAQLARLVKGLRERGLLAGAVDEGDRRNTRLTLTAEGQALQRGLRAQARKVGAAAVVGLSAAEQAQLAALLQRVRQNLEPPG